MLVVIAFFFWSILVIILSFVFSSQVWEGLQAREFGVKSEGSGGVALDEFQAAKIVVLTMLMGMMSVVGAYSIGETTDQLITYFDEYSNDKTESDDKNTGTDDATGTAAGQDMLYHFLTVVYTYILWSAITFGGYIFSFSYASFTEPAECDTWDSYTPQQIQ